MVSNSTATRAREIFALYALGLIGIAVEIWLLYLRAWKLREALRLNAQEDRERERGAAKVSSLVISSPRSRNPRYVGSASSCSGTIEAISP